MFIFLSVIFYLKKTYRRGNENYICIPITVIVVVIEAVNRVEDGKIVSFERGFSCVEDMSIFVEEIFKCQRYESACRKC